MSRPPERKTTIMRVPVDFKVKIFKMAGEYGYKTTTEYIEKDVTQILDNAHYLTRLLFGTRQVKKK